MSTDEAVATTKQCWKAAAAINAASKKDGKGEIKKKVAYNHVCRVNGWRASHECSTICHEAVISIRQQMVEEDKIKRRHAHNKDHLLQNHIAREIAELWPKFVIPHVHKDSFGDYESYRRDPLAEYSEPSVKLAVEAKEKAGLWSGQDKAEISFHLPCFYDGPSHYRHPIDPTIRLQSGVNTTGNFGDRPGYTANLMIMVEEDCYTLQGVFLNVQVDICFADPNYTPENVLKTFVALLKQEVEWYYHQKTVIDKLWKDREERIGKVKLFSCTASA